MRRWLISIPLAGRLLTLALFAGIAGPSLAQPGAPSAAPRRDIIVMTSFPSAFYEPFRRAFEQREPGYRLRIHNRKTTAAMEQVTSGRFADADLFWASSPDAFYVLKAAGRLAPLPSRVETEERMIGSFPLDDPDGLFRGFAVSGYGMMWNNAMLARAGLPAPAAIADLADPRFRGLIAMSAPSRSGTTHLMVEAVLQRYGWERGWSLWLRIAGNLATITARSFSVSSGVAQERFAVGLSIDFLGRGSDTDGKLGFAYPAEAVFLPASIAVLKGGREPVGAQRFARFVLSQEGQALLRDPKIRRQPLARAPAGDGVADLFALAAGQSDARPFDAALSGQRYELVNLLFDEMITERLVRLQRFWRRVAELRARHPQGRDDLSEIARAEAEASQIPAEMAGFGRSLPTMRIARAPRGVPASDAQGALVERLRREAEQALDAAERRLEALAQRLEAEAPRSPGAVLP